MINTKFPDFVLSHGKGARQPLLLGLNLRLPGIDSRLDRRHLRNFRLCDRNLFTRP